MSQRFALLLVLGALLAAGVAVLARGASGLDRTPAANAACKEVGWIAAVHGAAPKPSLRLAGASKACACPGGNCSKVAKKQRLFANETMISGGGKITFKSVVTGVPNLTCIVSSKSRNVIYPQSAHEGQRGRSAPNRGRGDVVPGRAGGLQDHAARRLPRQRCETDGPPPEGPGLRHQGGRRGLAVSGQEGHGPRRLEGRRPRPAGRVGQRGCGRCGHGAEARPRAQAGLVCAHAGDPPDRREESVRCAPGRPSHRSCPGQVRLPLVHGRRHSGNWALQHCHWEDHVPAQRWRRPGQRPTLRHRGHERHDLVHRRWGDAGDREDRSEDAEDRRVPPAVGQRSVEPGLRPGAQARLVHRPAPERSDRRPRPEDGGGHGVHPGPDPRQPPGGARRRPARQCVVHRRQRPASGDRSARRRDAC